MLHLMDKLELKRVGTGYILSRVFLNFIEGQACLYLFLAVYFLISRLFVSHKQITKISEEREKKGKSVSISLRLHEERLVREK